jgi:5-methylcytosine-specific restriction endonuclease McrA
LLAEGLSLAEIGRRTGQDRSTIGKLAKRYGLTPVGQAKYAPKPIKREVLLALVERGTTVPEIARHFGVSATTARKHLHRQGLKTAHAEALRARRIARGSRTMVCEKHGPTRFEIDAQGSYRCLPCRAEAVARRRRKVKRILVEEAGGACSLCGYGRYTGALHFHHRDPAEKDFGLSWGGFTMALEKLRSEAAKCVLLCSNCHAEVEAGIVELPLA